MNKSKSKIAKLILGHNTPLNVKDRLGCTFSLVLESAMDDEVSEFMVRTPARELLQKAVGQEICHVDLRGDEENDGILLCGDEGSVMNLRGCRVSMSYYRGFFYLVLRRYSDAAKCFEMVLRDELRQARQAKEEILNDMIEQTIGRMKAFFATGCTGYCLSERVDDLILGEVLDQFKSEWTGLEKCDEAAYSELFEFGRPDFISLYASESEDAVRISESKPGPQCAQFFLRAIEKSGEHQTTLARLGM
eukprot:748197_1